MCIYSEGGSTHIHNCDPVEPNGLRLGSLADSTEVQKILVEGVDLQPRPLGPRP